MTGTEVALNALNYKNSYKYLYGAKGEYCMTDHVEALIAAYPDYFDTAAKKAKAREKVGYNCADCSGYVCLVSGIAGYGSWGLYDHAAERRQLVNQNGVWKADGENIPIGAVLWKPGHVGIYIGAQKDVEARSEEYDITVNDIDGRGFTHVLLLPEISYSPNTADTAVTASGAPQGYIPWTGKIVNTVSVTPSILPSEGALPAPGFGLYRNGSLIEVVDLSGNYYKVHNNGHFGYVNSYYIGNISAAAYENSYIEWEGTVKGADNHVNVRTAPSVNAGQHATVPSLVNGSHVTVIGETLGQEDRRLWYYVRIAGQLTGYIRADLVESLRIENYTPWYGKAESTTGTVNIRQAATVNSSLSTVRSSLTNGDRVKVIGEERGSDAYTWYKVEVYDVYAGYVRGDLIKVAVDGYYVEWPGLLQSSTGVVNIRSGAGTAYQVIPGSPYQTGTYLKVTGEVMGGDGFTWYKVRVGDLYSGYVRADLVRPASFYPHWEAVANTTTGTLNIRSGTGTSYSLLTSVTNGTILRVISQSMGEDCTIWYKVTLNNDSVIGFVKGTLVKPRNTPAYPTWTGYAASTTGIVYVRSEPNTQALVIDYFSPLTNGTSFEVIGETDGSDGYVWYRVRIAGMYYGYIRSDLVSHGTSAEVPHGYAAWTGYVKGLGTAQNVNMRADAGTDAALVISIPNYSNVEVIGTKNGGDGYVWYQAKYGTKNGYIRSDLVFHVSSTAGDSPYQDLSRYPRGVVTDSVVMREYPNSGAEDVQVLTAGTYLTLYKMVTSEAYGTWYQASTEEAVNGSIRSGYVPVQAVKGFPNATECQEGEHEYNYPEYDVLMECQKCGKHVKYEKPTKATILNNVFPYTPATLDFYNNGVIDVRPGILFDSFLEIIYEMENDLEEFELNNNRNNTNETIVNTILGLARKNGYDDAFWKGALWDYTDYSDSFIDISDLSLRNKVKLFFTDSDKDHSPMVLLNHYIDGESVISTNYIKWKHFAATLEGYWKGISAVPKHFFGWGGDIATLTKQIENGSGNKLLQSVRYFGQTSQSYALQQVHYPEDSASAFSFEDLLADVDAICVSQDLNQSISNGYNKHFLSDLLGNYFLNGTSRRRQTIINHIKGNLQINEEVTSLQMAIIHRCQDDMIIEGTMPNQYPDTFPGFGNAYQVFSMFTILGTESIEAAAFAMAKYLLTEDDSLQA